MNSRPTHPLETWARQVFGADFALVILHGLLGEGGDCENLVTVEGFDREGRKRRKTLGVTGPGPGPWGLGPLVLAALLKRLVERPEIERRLDYSYQELFAELVWPSLPASRRAVEDAVAFYYACSYSTAAAPVGGEGGYSTRGRHSLLIGQGRDGIGMPRCGRPNEDGDTVWFDPDLIEGLREGRVVFAGIDFGEFRLGGAASGVGLRQPHGGNPKMTPPDADWPFRPPGPRPVLTFEVGRASRRSAGRGPKKTPAMAVGETLISVNTEAIAGAILRAIDGVAARHPPRRPCPSESAEALADYVHREVERLTREEAYKFVGKVERLVSKDVLYRGYGLIHSMPPKGAKRSPGPWPVWHSADQLVGALERAVEAIEFDCEWRPANRVALNKRWRPGRVCTATVKLVAAYWAEKERLGLHQVDSSKMSKWLRSFGLPCFTDVRTWLRGRIAERREFRTSLEYYEGSFLAFVALSPAVNRLN